jgi:aldose 1-epimerase
MIGMPIPLTGTQYEIAAGDYFAVVTELGAGLRQLHHRGEPLLAGYQAGELPPGASGTLLVPGWTGGGTPLTAGSSSST